MRELVDESQNIRTQYAYTPWGKQQQLAGDLITDNGYTGHYLHQQSSLYLAPYRAYDPNNARWLNRDPIKENGGINVYGYVGNNSLNYNDRLGLAPEINLFNKKDRLYHQHQLIPDIPGEITITAHGHEGGVLDYRGSSPVELSPADLAKMIMALPGVDPNSPVTVRIHACNTGAGSDSFAEKLVKLLPKGSIVYAPNGFCLPYGRKGLAPFGWDNLIILSPTYDGEGYEKRDGTPGGWVTFKNTSGGGSGGWSPTKKNGKKKFKK